MTQRPMPKGPSPTRDEMDALRDVAFHHPVDPQVAARLESLGLVELKRGTWSVTEEGRARLVHGAG
jgi:hypothetical protein